MSVILEWKGDDILCIRNGVFSEIYQNMLKIIEEKKGAISRELTWLIDNLYAGLGGIGLDLADYLKNKQDFTIFLDLLKKAITKFEDDYGDNSLAQESLKELWSFYNKMLLIGENFS